MSKAVGAEDKKTPISSPWWGTLPKVGGVVVKTEKTKNDLLHSLALMNTGHGEHGEEVSDRSFEMSQGSWGLSLEDG